MRRQLRLPELAFPDLWRPGLVRALCPKRHMEALQTSSPIAEAGLPPSSARDKQGADPSEQQQRT